MYRQLSIALLAACSSPPAGPRATPDAAATDGAHDGRPVPSSNVIVSLTFDDTLADQFQVGAMLASHGMHATFFVNSPRIGQTDAMTLLQLRQLRDQGNEIAGHTLDHVYLSQLDPESARHQICDDRTALVAMGFEATTFAYPFGDSTATVEQIVRDCGYVAARSVGGLYASDSCTTCPYANAMPPANPYGVHTVPSIAGATTADTLEAYVIDAEQHGGGWLPLVFHHVCDACNASQVRPAVLEAFLDRLEQRGNRVMTVADVIAIGP